MSNISIISIFFFIFSYIILAEILPTKIMSFILELALSCAFPSDALLSIVLQGNENCMGCGCLVAAVWVPNSTHLLLELGGQFLDMENIFPDRLEEDARMGGFLKITVLEAEDKGTFSVGD